MGWLSLTHTPPLPHSILLALAVLTLRDAQTVAAPAGLVVTTIVLLWRNHDNPDANFVGLFVPLLILLVQKAMHCWCSTAPDTPHPLQLLETGYH